MLTKHKLNALINIENVSSNLLEENLTIGRAEFFQYSDIFKGLPILVPADPDIFEFNECDTFFLSDSELMKIFYGKVQSDYIGFRLSFNSNKFLSSWNVRKKFKKKLSEITTLNYSSINKIQNLKSKFNNIAAFQTRNIPHFGHEAIIQELLKQSDHVVINPVIGPKKKGDLTVQALDKVYCYLADTKYNNQISFVPIYAQMFYAGPREAIHHALLRQRLGFTKFSVGRDHAGADSFYDPLEAPRVIDENRDKLQISVFCHSGAVFCKKCKKPIISDSCCHDHSQLLDISGTDLRNSLKNGTNYEYADLEMQNFIKREKLELFEK